MVRDHRVHDAAVLPGVGFLEMASAAASRLLPGGRASLRRVFWLNRLEVTGPVDVRLHVYPEREHHRFQIASGGDEPTVFAEGELHPAAPAPEASGERLALQDIQARCAELADGEQFYRGLEGSILRYGPYFRVIKRVWASREEALALLELDGAFRGELDRYGLHPALMDGALQTAMALSASHGREGQAIALPYTVERVDVLRPLGARLYAHVRQAEKDRYKVSLLDVSGAVCVELQGLVVRAPRDPLGRLFFRPRWVSEPAEEARDAAGPGAVLVFAPPSWGDAAQPIAAVHTDRRVVLVTLSRETRLSGVDRLEVDRRDPEAFAACLRANAPIAGIYFLGGLQAGPAALDDLEALERSQESGVFAAFHLLRAILALRPAPEGMFFKVVVDRVHPVRAGERVAPHGGDLVGFCRSAAKELSGVRIGVVDVVDVDAAELRRDGEALRAGALWRAIARDPGAPGGVVAYRDGVRSVPILEPVALPPAPHAPFKRSGVYLIAGGTGGIGIELARYLAEHFAARLVLLGRKPPSAVAAQQIEEIRALGGEVLQLQADIADEQSMRAAVASARERFGRIDGAIHAAMVLADRTLMTMDAETLRSVLRPKVRGSVVLCRALRDEPLDLLMFFSAGQSFLCNAGQSNYAAGCVFKDAFALALHQQTGVPVRIINWGFWGSVGAVANEEVRQRLSALGVHPIHTHEGLEAVVRVAASPLEQVLAFKAEPGFLQAMGVRWERRYQAFAPAAPSLIEAALDRLEPPSIDARALELSGEASRALQAFGARALLRALQGMGALRRAGERRQVSALREGLQIAPHYHRLFDALLGIVERAGWARVDGETVTAAADLPDALHAWDQEQATRRLLQEHPGLEDMLRFLSACLSAYGEVLTGRRGHMDVLFPGGTTSLVENIYKGSPVVDHYNRWVALVVARYCRLRLAEDPTAVVRVLEVGAGTGGTTAFVLEALASFGDRVQLVFTDISAAFVRQGERTFGDRHPAAEFKVLDLEKDPEAQGFRSNDVDVVFGTNVFHATRQIERTAGWSKRLLRPGGLLILNEVTRVQEYPTLTFGLTPGWWHFEDEPLRMKGSPLLSIAGWREVLGRLGFRGLRALGLPGVALEAQDQAVLVVESDGVVELDAGSPAPTARAAHAAVPPERPERAREVREINGAARGHEVRASEPVNGHAREQGNGHGAEEQPARQRAAVAAQPPAEARQDRAALLESTRTYVKGIFSDVLKIEPESIQDHRNFDAYGVDSLVVLNVTRRFEQRVGALPSTLLFEKLTVEDLAVFFVDHHEAALRASEPPGAGGGGAEPVRPRANPERPERADAPERAGVAPGRRAPSPPAAAVERFDGAVPEDLAGEVARMSDAEVERLLGWLQGGGAGGAGGAGATNGSSAVRASLDDGQEREAERRRLDRGPSGEWR